MSATQTSEREQRLGEVLAALFEAEERGEPLDRAGWLARYPEFAEELSEFFESADRLDSVAIPLREAVAAARPIPGQGTQRGPGESVGLSNPLGDFQIVREVGRGGMGVVYEAVQRSLGRRVALKVLPFAATLDPRQLQRFKNEAQAAAGLQHQNIVPVHFVGCERGVHYYAMQFIDGQTVAAIIRELRQINGPDGSAPPPAAPATVPAAGLATERSVRTPAYFRAAARLGQQAAEALQHAHALGVVHRDVKPGNLMLDERGNLWVADFGLARVQTDASLTLTGDLVGTVRYMSPEQAQGRHALIDHRTDVYSLGATLYELLTLQPAFSGTDRQELLRKITAEEPTPPRRVNKAIPTELETIVLKAMEKNPADRYATAQELADDLERYLTNEPIRARRPSLVQRARKVARRHPGVTVTAAVALVAGLLLGVAGLAVNNRMIRQEQFRTQAALKRAEQEKAVAQAVRDFLTNKLLAQADPRAQADAQLRGGGKPKGPRPNPTIRELLDRAAAELAPDKIEEQFPGQPLVQAEILKTIGEAYRAIGEYGLAIAHLQRARDLHIRELGADHADTLATMESLARAYLDDGKATEAAGLFEQVRDLRTEKLGPDHPDTLVSMNDLARAYHRLKRYDEALRLREDIVRRRKATLGPDHPGTLASMMNLANSYAALRPRFAEARDLHEKTLALRKATLGADHPDTLQSMNNLANCYAYLDQQAEALKIHEEALALRRARLGPDDPDTLQSMNNVAVTYSALGRHEEALNLHEETLALRKAKLHLDHPDTLQSMNALAWLLANSPDRKLRNPDRALELAKKAVELAPEKGDYRNTLGTAYYRAGDWKSSVGALTGSMQLRKGGDATDWFFLAMAHWRLGEKNEARTWYDRAVRWMETNKPDEELHRFRAEATELLELEKR